MLTATVPAPPLWLHSRRFDLFWYAAVPVLLYVVMVAASRALGAQGPVLVYTASAVLTGLPHNMITWLLLLPRESRRYYQPGVLFGPFALTAIAMVPTVLLFGTPYFGWALTVNVLIAYHHITRQHMGMMQLADARYRQATGDDSIGEASCDLRWLIGAFAACGFAWKLTGGPLSLGLQMAPVRFTLWPVPMALPVVLTALCLWLAARLAWNMAARMRAGRRFPTLHAVMGGAALANLSMASLVPNDQFFLSLALIASYHNLQYFAFVYTHHHLRAVADPRPQDPFSRWARERRWGPWFLLPIALGAGFAALSAAVPPFWGTLLATWLMTSHYFVDGHMWRRKYYPDMGRFGRGYVLEPAAAASAPPGPVEVPR